MTWRKALSFSFARKRSPFNSIIFLDEENFPWRAHIRHNCSEGEGQGDVHVFGSQSFQLTVTAEEGYGSEGYPSLMKNRGK